MTKTRENLGVLTPAASFVGAIWIVFLVDWILPWEGFQSLGLVPRTLSGAWGIVGMPFVHMNFDHIISNTVPLLVLITLLAVTEKGWGDIAAIVVVGGILLWIFGHAEAPGGERVVHGGASGLIFCLIALMIVVGFVEKKLLPMLVGVGVGLFYGTTVLFGVLPTHPGVSWDGHLTGAVAGIVVAFFHKKGKKEKTGKTVEASGTPPV